LHHDSLMTYAGLLPYFIAQGTLWFVQKIIKMQLHSGLLKGWREKGLPTGVQVADKYRSETGLIYFAKKNAGLSPGFIKPEGY